MKNQTLILHFFLVIGFFSLTACLETRTSIQETEQKKVIQEQVVQMQKSNADQGNRFNELSEGIRSLNGRVEALENHNQIVAQDKDRAKKSQEEERSENAKKLALFQEELVKLQNQILELQKEPKVKPSTANPFDTAQELFKNTDYKKAIVQFQKYREQFPKGKQMPEATYKIGVSFQELGMKDEARTFFDEVISRYPNSSFSKSAKGKLKAKK